MREFLLYSRTGQTSGRFENLMSAGRLDIVYQCILTSIFKSQAHRHDVIFHAILNGPPNAPLHIEINGDNLKDARIDEDSWGHIIGNVLRNRRHEGISVEKCSLQELIKQKHIEGKKIMLMDNKGISFLESGISRKDDVLFIVGDHIGISRNEESFVMRYGKKLSIGKEKYLAASCIDIINYLLDIT